MAACAVAVTVHVFKVMVECVPGLRAIHMYMNIPVSLVDLLYQAFGGQARATSMRHLRAKRADQGESIRVVYHLHGETGPPKV